MTVSDVGDFLKNLRTIQVRFLKRKTDGDSLSGVQKFLNVFKKIFLLFFFINMSACSLDANIMDTSQKEIAESIKDRALPNLVGGEIIHTSNGLVVEGAFYE